MPNEVWRYKLKPIEFVILSYLCCCHHHNQVAVPKAVAEGVHLTVDTVKKYVTALVNKKLITEDRGPLLKCEDKNFFTLPNEIFLLDLPPSAFMVYAYLLLIENRQTHTCHPSYRTISAAAGISRNTAMKCIGTLLDMGLITSEASQYFDECGMKWRGNNRYTILPIQCAVEDYHQRQLSRLEETLERQRAQARLSRPVSRCVPAEGIGKMSAQQRAKHRAVAFVDDVGQQRLRKLRSCGGRKKKQDKSQTPQAASGWGTSARSAGS